MLSFKENLKSYWNLIKFLEKVLQQLEKIWGYLENLEKFCKENKIKFRQNLIKIELVEQFFQKFKEILKQSIENLKQ